MRSASCGRLTLAVRHRRAQRLHHLIGDGFHLAVAERAPSENTDGEGLITHSDRFVLVDGNLQIRGYYHGTEEESVQQLLTDVRTLRVEAGTTKRNG